MIEWFASHLGSSINLSESFLLSKRCCRYSVLELVLFSITFLEPINKCSFKRPLLRSVWYRFDLIFAQGWNGNAVQSCTQALPEYVVFSMDLFSFNSTLSFECLLLFSFFNSRTPEMQSHGAWQHRHHKSRSFVSGAKSSAVSCCFLTIMFEYSADCAALKVWTTPRSAPRAITGSIEEVNLISIASRNSPSSSVTTTNHRSTMVAKSKPTMFSSVGPCLTNSSDTWTSCGRWRAREWKFVVDRRSLLYSPRMKSVPLIYTDRGRENKEYST